jgi:hypothetical protein
MRRENLHERIVIDETVEWVLAAAATDGTTEATGNTASAGPQIPERLQVLTAKSQYWATALSMERDRLRSYQRAFGYPVVIITALTGMAAFTQLDGNPAWWAKLTVVIASAVATVLAAVQTQQNFAKRATEADNASDSFGALFGEMLDAEDQLLTGSKPSKELKQLYAEYAKLKEDRPMVPERVGEHATRKIEQDASVRRTLAQSRMTEAKLRSTGSGSTKAP